MSGLQGFRPGHRAAPTVLKVLPFLSGFPQSPELMFPVQFSGLLSCFTTPPPTPTKTGHGAESTQETQEALGGKGLRSQKMNVQLQTPARNHRTNTVLLSPKPTMLSRASGPLPMLFPLPQIPFPPLRLPSSAFPSQHLVASPMARSSTPWAPLSLC